MATAPVSITGRICFRWTSFVTAVPGVPNESGDLLQRDAADEGSS
ncbi:hypothetical protein [Streptomyces sp. NPDC001914]